MRINRLRIPRLGNVNVLPSAAPPSYLWYQYPGTKAAYQAKGAASLAASLVNLASPGTNDLSVPVTDPVSTSPTWNSSDGRIYDGINRSLEIGAISIVPNTFTLFIRYSNLNLSIIYPEIITMNSSTIVILDDALGDGVGIESFITGSSISKLNMDSAPTGGVIAVNNYGLYLNGSLIATNDTPSSTESTSTTLILSSISSNYKAAFYEQAVMLHDNGTTVLSAAAIKDISDQMAAL